MIRPRSAARRSRRSLLFLTLLCALGPFAPSRATTEPPSCLSGPLDGFVTKRFAFESRCHDPSANADCYYHDYRATDLPTGLGFDQRGVTGFQVSFPIAVHRWAALAIREPVTARHCWIGGALVGRNPLAMTWAGEPGGKRRKNNFLLSEGGTLQVERARVHNTHDTFLAASPHAGFDIRDSWFSRTRDDFVEGHLGRLALRDSLIDGTYTFLSSPDDCTGGMGAAERTVVIERSLIRLQRMPGPYAREADRWHASIAGGHHRLWKLDHCQWRDWPRFVLRDNVFLIEGPPSSSWTLFRAACDLGLPGACGDAGLSQLVECENNLFLYRDYHHWLDQGITPGAVPQPGGRFHNPANPDFRPNGRDCYQRVTDDLRDAGFGDPLAIWTEKRAAWIDRVAGPRDAPQIARIAGVDEPPAVAAAPLRLVNRASGLCLDSDGIRGVRMNTCIDSPRQVFRARSADDGVLAAALLLEDHTGALLRTGDVETLTDARDFRFDSTVFATPVAATAPDFGERWYLLPQAEEPGGCPGAFAIESDAPGRSFLRADGNRVTIQPFYEQAELTALPQATFASGDDRTLQWIVTPADAATSHARHPCRSHVDPEASADVCAAAR